MLLLLSFILCTLFSSVQAECTTDMTKVVDFIVMLDYSDSVCEQVQCCNAAPGECLEVPRYAHCCANEWELTLEFAADIVRNHLPTYTRFAAMGFGRNFTQEEADKNWYFGGTVDGWVTDANDAADRILNPAVTVKHGGPSYLGRALDLLLSDPSAGGKIDWLEDENRHRLLMIITDGRPSEPDTLCQRATLLKDYNIETLIVGVSDKFMSEPVRCLVSEDDDIILVDDFTNLEDRIDDVVRVTCETTHTVFVRETITKFDWRTFLAGAICAAALIWFCCMVFACCQPGTYELGDGSKDAGALTASDVEAVRINRNPQYGQKQQVEDVEVVNPGPPEMYTDTQSVVSEFPCHPYQSKQMYVDDTSGQRLLVDADAVQPDMVQQIKEKTKEDVKKLVARGRGLPPRPPPRRPAPNTRSRSYEPSPEEEAASSSVSSGQRV